MKSIASAVLVAALVAAAPGAQAQEVGAPAGDAPRVFLDCSYFCDQNFIKTEINWVNWVRDQADAQVHILVTQQPTGGGGSQYAFNFIGLKERVGKADTLRYVSSTTDTPDQTREGMVRVLKAGLVPYTLNTSLATRLQIGMAAPASPTAGQSTPTTAPARDPWNFWVFSMGARANLDGEQSQSSTNFSGNLSANRTTEAFKIRIGVNGNRSQSEYTFPLSTTQDTTIKSERKNYNLSLLAVKSITDHWSAGLSSGANSGTFGNIELGVNAGPAVEWSFWPYKEAQRRSLAFRYSVGMRKSDYRERTIFNKMEETHANHSLTAELDLRQRWGSVSLSSSFNQYLHDRSKYNMGVFGSANVRLFKGFSVDFFGNYNKVRDQLSLAAGDLTQDEVLLRQQELETGYRYFTGFGLRYSFGSIFNNVVNPRFGDGGGGMMIMF